jgi:hypothetical protein
MPASSVSRVSSATDRTPSFVVIAVRCRFTVRSWMPRSSAICLFSLPCTTWPSTSSSRSLSASKRAQLTLPGALLAFALIASEGTFHRIDQLFLVIAGLQPRPNLTSKQITLLDFCNQLV